MKQNYRSTPMQPPQHALPRPAEARAARERHAAPAARPPAPLSHPEPDARPPEAKPRRHPAEIAAPVRRDNHAPAITVRRAAVLLCGCIVLLLAAACTAGDDFAPTPGGNGTATPAAALTITVTDGAYAPAATAPDDDATPGTVPDAAPAAPGTRAAERGYGTEFTAGDRIGLYEVWEGSGSPESLRRIIRTNLCLTYDGTAWTLPPGTQLFPEQPSFGGRMYYYAYYPYQDDSYMDSRITLSKQWFFATGEPLPISKLFGTFIEQWQPARDQSTYEAYTASDLMVARGTVAKRTDGGDGSVLRFTMEHQMALVVARVPSTEYTYTETIGGNALEKSYRLYTGLLLGGSGWRENSHTARYLVNPHNGSTFILGGSYYNSAGELRKFTVSPNPSADPGKYRLFTIDGGTETVAERPLKEGDYYMRDGSILPGDAFPGGIPADVKKDCIAVVFWVGEKDGMHWTKDDLLLMRDHPGCTHGMVVALKDASDAAAWATGSAADEDLHTWAKYFSGFTDEEQETWKMTLYDFSRYYGYSTECLAELYARHHPDAGFPARETVRTYAATHPAPDGSSGWFFPGRSEFAALAFGAPYNYDGIYKNLAMLKKINPRIEKAGGTIVTGEYWTNFGGTSVAWQVKCDNNDPFYSNKPKTNEYKVRAVLAF